MAEPGVLIALGVAIGKLLLRAKDLPDAADAVEDVHSGFKIVTRLAAKGEMGRVNQAITKQLEMHLRDTIEQTRQGEMRIAAGNVAVLFTKLSDQDIVAAAKDPEGFPDYVLRGPARWTLELTGKAVTPLAEKLIRAATEVFVQNAPYSSRFTSGALVELLKQADSAAQGITQIQGDLSKVQVTSDKTLEQVEGLHPKVDIIVEAVRGPQGAVEASREATREGRFVGKPIGQWDPSDLGVHTSISVGDNVSLTPYLDRDHDQQLRQMLTQAGETGRASLIVVTGTSCTGKTRTLYEAVSETFPDWQLTFPRSDNDLARLLTEGVPAQSIVWLDEMQGHLTKTPDGITAAKALIKLIHSDGVGPILLVGTIWPTNLAALEDRPTPTEASQGGDKIPDLLAKAARVRVPDAFSGPPPDDRGDPRLRLALDTATHSDHPEPGLKITQVLAGGSQLVNRLYPPTGTHPSNKFSPAARAVLHAAADMRRVGLPNPIPRWAIEGAAPGYLHPPTIRPASTWLETAIAEVTQAAQLDDPLTGAQSHDIHRHGVPALTPSWMEVDGTTSEAYELHDFLLQDHLIRHRHTPTRQALWDTLVTHRLRPTSLTDSLGG